MVNDLYALDLETLVWEKIETGPLDGNISPQRPQPRYFHSCNEWKGKLIIFGGMGYAGKAESTEGTGAEKTEPLCVLDQVIAFDLTTRQWDFDFTEHAEASSDPPPHFKPAPRYAHLSSVSADSLIVIGGQDVANQYVDQINVLDLNTRQWIASTTFQRQCGSYRSLAISSPLAVQPGRRPDELVSALTGEAKGNTTPRQSPATLGSLADSLAHMSINSSSADTRSDLNGSRQTASDKNVNGRLPNPLRLLPMSYVSGARDKSPPVYIYSNYNFTDVQRELEVASISKNAQGEHRVILEDQSSQMTGASLPPGLRFPTGVIIGDHLVISGTYLANTSQTFSIWALHLPTLTWSRLDAGPSLQSGSWNRASLWARKNQLVVLGNRDRDLVTDYNHRQNNWDHALLIDLEAWGISQPPMRPMSEAAMRMGLSKLDSALSTSRYATPLAEVDGQSHLRGFKKPPAFHSKAYLGRSKASGEQAVSIAGIDGSAGDFEIVCSDGVHLGCDRVVLEAHWPWFREKMRRYQKQAKAAAELVIARRPHDSVNDMVGSSTPRTAKARFNASLVESESGFTTRTSSPQPAAQFSPGSKMADIVRSGAVDCRFIPRHLQLSEPSPVVLALLQFFYTQSICTSLQRHPAVVASLLILDKVYGLEDTLGIWARHAASSLLSDEFSPDSLTLNTTDGAGGPFSPRGEAAATFESASTTFSNQAGEKIPVTERHCLAVALYEAAGLSGCEPLQLKALRAVVALSKLLQRSPPTASSTIPPGQPLRPVEMIRGATTDLVSTEGSQNGTRAGSPSQRPARPLSLSLTSPISPISPATENYDSDRGTFQSTSSNTKAARLLGLNQSKVERRLGITAEEARMGQMLGRSSPSPFAAAGQDSLPPSARRPSAPSIVSQGSTSAPTVSSNMVNSNLLRPDVARSGTAGRKRFSIFGRNAGAPGAEEGGAETLTRVASGGSTAGSAEQHYQQARGQPYGSDADTLVAGSGSVASSSSSHPSVSAGPTAGSLPPPALSVKEMKRMEKLEKKRMEAQAKAAAKKGGINNTNTNNNVILADSIVSPRSPAFASSPNPSSGGRSRPSLGSSSNVKASPAAPPAFFSLG